MKDNYPDLEEDDILPDVKKGSSVTGDNYWKGIYGHETADFIRRVPGAFTPILMKRWEVKTQKLWISLSRQCTICLTAQAL
mgnify:FL=1